MRKIRLDRSPPAVFRLQTALRRSVIGRRIYRRRWASRADVVVVSFPKAGRTWLRALLSAALHHHYGIARSPGDPLSFDALRHDPRVPRIRFKHDDAPQLKRPEELVRVKSEYREVRVILLVRDLRDLAVSCYFQMTRRERRFSGDLEAFLHNRRGGLDTMIEFFNIWAQNRDQPADLALLRYEDLHHNPRGELLRALSLCGIPEVATPSLEHAVEAASFERMRGLEASATSQSGRLQPGDPSDPESFKTRRGQVGGYRDYLSPTQAARIEARMREELSPWFGYPN